MQWNETHTDDIPPTRETPAKLIGTWQVTVTFHEGPLQGQSEVSRLFFAPDRTLLILLPNPGAGNSQSDVSDAISFSFTELLNYRADGACTGYVMVKARGSLSQDGTSFAVSGQGEVYSADGTHLATNKTTAQGTRIRHKDSTSTLAPVGSSHSFSLALNCPSREPAP
jgi:hypothetical protein